MPSQSVIRICEATEKIVRKVLQVTDNKMLRDSGLRPAIKTSVLAEVGNSVFTSLDGHMLDMETENNHVFSLIRGVVDTYLNVRLHHVVKTQNNSLKDKRVRKTYSKLILFAHQ